MVYYINSQFYFRMPRRRDESDDSEDQDDDESLEGAKVQIRKPKIQRIDKFKNLKKIVINVSMTQYPVVPEVAEELGWKIQYSNDAGDWDVFWTDFSIDPDILIKMHLFQKINHYPGIHNIARKNLLGQNLSNMGKKYPDQYNFFPMTWMLPQQYADFRAYYETKQKGKTRTYIVKPEADCQGRGIFLTRKIQQMQTGKHYVVQRYLARPYLIEGLKFDLRIYVLLAGTDPLRLYMYDQGLARFATQLYHEPMNANLDKLCMHLTNYAINKHNKNFIFNTSDKNMGVGHKRSLTAVYKQMADKGMDVPALKQRIKSIIIKTVISGLPLMSHQYKFSQPQDYSGNMCFHILGLDVMINNKGDPYIIEVNHTPSFTTDTPLDRKIKHNLIKDTLQLMNINVKQKTQLYNRCKQYNTDRLLTGKRHIFEGSEREAKIKEAQLARDKYEKKHMGGYQKIYPSEDPQLNLKYQQMIGTANQIYMEGNTAVKNRYEAKEMKKLIRSDIKAQRKKEKQKVKEVMENKSMPPEHIAESQTEISIKEQREKVANMMPQSNPEIPIEQSISLSPRKQEKSQRIIPFNDKQSQISGVNAIRNSRDGTSYTADGRESSSFAIGKRQNTTGKRQKSQKIKPFYPNQHRQYSHQPHKNEKKQEPISALRKNQTYKKQQMPKELPNIDNNSVISDIFSSGNNNQLKKKTVGEYVNPNNHRIMLKSEPKPSRLLQNIQREMHYNEKRLMGSNGGYVMPKIFCLNMQAERRQQQMQQHLSNQSNSIGSNINGLNLLTLGKKIQSANFDEG